MFILAQDTKKEEPKFGVKFSGFVRNDMIFNTRQVASARGESNVLLFPKAISLDADEKDINAAPNFNLSSFTTRLRAKITGPDAFGAKTSGLIETDFLGPNGTATYALRIRHAMIKFDWETTSLLTGQYWHPMWATECFPGTVSFGAGVPFNPLSRNPQVRLTKKFGGISVMGAIMSQGMFQPIAGKAALQNSAIPEAHLQLQFKNDMISAGAGVNFQSLRPQLKTAQNYIDKTTINSLSFFGYMKVKTKPVVAKVYAMYGQNNDNMVMMGGYATRNMTYTAEQLSKGFVEYSPYNTLSTWVDFETTGKSLKFGLFAGYMQNMGAADSIDVSTFTGRWNNINTMLRVAPRVVYKVNKIKLGFEVEYSAVAYAKENQDASGNLVSGADVGGIDAFGKVTNSETADNIKLLVSIAYIF